MVHGKPYYPYLDIVKNNPESTFIKPDISYVVDFSGQIDRTGGRSTIYHYSALDYVFGDRLDRLKASQTSPMNSVVNKRLPPKICTHGIQYKPKERTGAPQSRRVLIAGLQPDSDVRKFMAKVVYGPLVRMSWANSPAPINHTVILEFVNHENAAKYAKYAQQNAKELFGEGAGVALIGTHSYPLSNEMYNDVLQGFTRLLVCVKANNFNVLTFLNQFKKIYRDPEDVLEDVYMDERNNLYILFKDLAHASFFYKLVMWREAVLRKDGLKNQEWNLWRFGRDPCDRLPPKEPSELTSQARGDHKSLMDEWLLCSKVRRMVHIFDNTGKSPLSMPTEEEVDAALEAVIEEHALHEDWLDRSLSPSAMSLCFSRTRSKRVAMGRPETRGFMDPELSTEDLYGPPTPDPEITTPTRSAHAESGILQEASEARTSQDKGKGKQKQATPTISIIDLPDDSDVSGVLNTAYPPLEADISQSRMVKYIDPQNNPYYRAGSALISELVPFAEMHRVWNTL
ncbi:hypothetical protein F5Y05DRAFT_421685 [Hypoxylon sp. FL0543]|nr:hypothetical protein F5Y05DRAFT_421685 [Hypoxylon sp. FL0543]